MSYDIGRPSPGLGQVQQMTGSPTAIHKQMIKNLDRFTSTQKDHTPYKK